MHGTWMLTLAAGMLLWWGSQAKAAGPFHCSSGVDLVLPLKSGPAPSDSTSKARRENPRLVSSTLAVLLGPFGAHRLYLGTTPKVAVVYGITFGGFGLLPLLDLGHLLFSKDLDRYRNNDRVFMWNAPRTVGATTPP